MRAPRQFHGWRIRGLTLFWSYWYPDGRRIGIAAYHHPERMCWLWFFEIYARRGVLPRMAHLPGAQAKTYIDLPFCTLLFVWQDQGRYTDPRDERIRKLVGVKDWPVRL